MELSHAGLAGARRKARCSCPRRGSRRKSARAAALCHGQLRLAPGAQATVQGVDGTESGLLESLGRARGCLPVFAVDGNRQRLGFGQILALRIELAHAHVPRARDMALVVVLDAGNIDQQRIVAIDQLGQACWGQGLEAARQATNFAGDDRGEHTDEAEGEERMIADELGQALDEFGHGGIKPDAAHSLRAG